MKTGKGNKNPTAKNSRVPKRWVQPSSGQQWDADMERALGKGYTLPVVLLWAAFQSWNGL